MLVPRNVICWLISCVCVCLYVCLVALLICTDLSLHVNPVFFGIMYLRIMLYLICVRFVTKQTSKKRFHPKITLYSLDLVFCSQKNTVPKNRWFSFTGSLHDVTLGQCESRSFANGTYLWTATGFVSWVTFKSTKLLEPGGKKHETWWNRVACPRIHVWNIYLHMYGKWPVCR